MQEAMTIAKGIINQITPYYPIRAFNSHSTTYHSFFYTLAAHNVLLITGHAATQTSRSPSYYQEEGMPVSVAKGLHQSLATALMPFAHATAALGTPYALAQQLARPVSDVLASLDGTSGATTGQSPSSMKDPMQGINEHLIDVSRIMARNIEGLVQRGERVSRLTDMSSALAVESRKYVKDARMVNLRALYNKYSSIAITIAVVLVFLMIWRYFSN